MNKLLITLLFFASLFMSACSNDNEPVVLDNIYGAQNEALLDEVGCFGLNDLIMRKL